MWVGLTLINSILEEGVGGIAHLSTLYLKLKTKMSLLNKNGVSMDDLVLLCPINLLLKKYTQTQNTNIHQYTQDKYPTKNIVSTIRVVKVRVFVSWL